MKQLSKFTEYLSSVQTTDKIFNQYSHADNLGYSLLTNVNLLCYLTTMFQRQPKTLFLGEAPGYKGCKLTGVPFTSEAIIDSGDIDFFNYSSPDGQDNFSKDSPPQKERTATIIWKTFKSLDYYPLLWNALPFYPHDSSKNKNNRKPTVDEIKKFGHEPFRKLTNMFSVKYFVAVGKTAEQTLTNFGVTNFQTVPHPSYGNATKFATELKRLLTDRQIE